ncbi:hypothetical protein SH661x_002439 [Planctomicrobium sp. SH661]|uniref:hypothetical protein n=1 Tax=Planctomicrobium sp. SH661 TaxID=3448124 RepID=UPI003F5AFF26
MNYLAHGIRYLDRPYFLIGSAIPDMLSVVDRKSRVRRKTIELRLPALTEEDHELALGMLQHLFDDQWFHGTAGFYAVTGTLGRHFRETLGPDDDWNCGFLGHIVTELLMDAVLSEDDPAALDAYYQACSQVDPQRIEHTVSAIATQPPRDLSRFIELFITERFLVDYTDDERLLFRLNQVMRRVQSRPLPRSVLQVLVQGRRLVREHMTDLLPEEHFAFDTKSLRPAGGTRVEGEEIGKPCCEQLDRFS